MALTEEFQKSATDLCRSLLDAIFKSENEGMGRDHIVQALAATLTMACKNYGFSYQYCQQEFDEQLNDIYELEEEEDEECDCCEKQNPCDCFMCIPTKNGDILKAPKETFQVGKETHQASPEMKIFFEKLLDLKAYIKKEYEWGMLHGTCTYPLLTAYGKLDEIIKEKK